MEAEEYQRAIVLVRGIRAIYEADGLMKSSD